MKKDEKPQRISVVTTFGRFNPPTAGHTKLINHIKTLASSKGADHRIFVSKTHDTKKNPLTHRDKLKFLADMSPGTEFHDESDVNNPLEAMKHLQKRGYQKVTFVVGKDREKEFKNLLNKYNGHEYKFEHINVVSAGERDPDSEGVKGISGTKMREAAMKGDFKSFVKGVSNKKQAKDLYSAVRKGMKTESYNALFLLGGPGSGKDVVLRSTVLGSKNILEINLDKLNKTILDKKDIEEINEGVSLIVNGNADDAGKVLLAKAVLESVGYRTSVLFVYTTDKVSHERHAQRGSMTFNEGVRAEKYSKSVTNLKTFTEQFKDHIIYDNSANVKQLDEEQAAWLEEINEKMTGFFSGSPEVDNQVADFLGESLVASNKSDEKKARPNFKGFKAAKPPSTLGNASPGGDRMGVSSALAAEEVETKTVKQLKERAPEEVDNTPEVYEDWGKPSEKLMFEGRVIRTNKPFKTNKGYAMYIQDGVEVKKLNYNDDKELLAEWDNL